MLTAWLRTKYPWAVMGGLSASAPFAFHGTSRYAPYAFMDSCEATYRDADSRCPNAVSAAFSALDSNGRTAAGRAAISTKLRLCKPINTHADALALLDYAQGALVDMAMLDYPFKADYGVHFPAWPVNATCSALIAHGADPLVALSAGLQNFYNATGARTCLDPVADEPDWGTGDGWPYLACGELYFPVSH